MSIRRLNLVLFLLLLGLLFVLFGSLGAIVWTQGKITEAEERRFRSVRLADELRQSSDDLTRMARLYVVTGDEEYKTWFHEILAIRDGKAPARNVTTSSTGMWCAPAGSAPARLGRSRPLKPSWSKRALRWRNSAS